VLGGHWRKPARAAGLHDARLCRRVVRYWTDHPTHPAVAGILLSWLVTLLCAAIIGRLMYWGLVGA
jgi:phosphate/sulfate permease